MDNREQIVRRAGGGGYDIRLMVINNETVLVAKPGGTSGAAITETEEGYAEIFAEVAFLHSSWEI